MGGEIEWVNPPDAVETGTRRGRGGFEGAQSAFGRAYRSVEFEVERLVEAGDLIGVIANLLYHGRASDIEVRQRLGMLFEIREGRLDRFEWSNHPEELLTGARLLSDES
jgi:ketosteroid isomerase-like protein